MDYLDQRQRIISQNIANADTPGYRPQDLIAGDFGKLVNAPSGKMNVTPSSTQSGHMSASGDMRAPDKDEQEMIYEVAPAGNSVIIEEQLINAGRNTMDYNMMVNLYQKNVAMMRTALGQGR